MTYDDGYAAGLSAASDTVTLFIIGVAIIAYLYHRAGAHSRNSRNY